MSDAAPAVCVPRDGITAPDVADGVTIAALLADPIRAGILRLLADGPYCVCELARALGARENNVSNHLGRLRDAGLVRASRHAVDARFLYYERDQGAINRARAIVRDIL